MNGQEEITSFHVWKHDVKTDILSARSDNAEPILNTKDLHHIIENSPGKIKSKLKNVERHEKNESKAWTQGTRIDINGNIMMNVLFLF